MSFQRMNDNGRTNAALFSAATRLVSAIYNIKDVNVPLKTHSRLGPLLNPKREQAGASETTGELKSKQKEVYHGDIKEYIQKKENIKTPHIRLKKKKKKVYT